MFAPVRRRPAGRRVAGGCRSRPAAPRTAACARATSLCGCSSKPCDSDQVLSALQSRMPPRQACGSAGETRRQADMDADRLPSHCWSNVGDQRSISGCRIALAAMTGVGGSAGRMCRPGGRQTMQTFQFDHLHLAARTRTQRLVFFETMFGARSPAASIRRAPCIQDRCGHHEGRRPEDPDRTDPSARSDGTLRLPFPTTGWSISASPSRIWTRRSPNCGQKGADVAVGPLTRDAGTYLAFIRGPEGIMVELVQKRRQA